MNIRLNHKISFNHSCKGYNHRNISIDISWKVLQNDHWYSTNPILGKQIPNYSNIENKFVDYVFRFD